MEVVPGQPGFSSQRPLSQLYPVLWEEEVVSDGSVVEEWDWWKLNGWKRKLLTAV